MALSTTPIPRMRAGWTACGACTSGSTAHPMGGTRPASGGAATTSTTGAEGPHGDFRASFTAHVHRRVSAALCGQRGDHDRLVHLPVGAGRHADARRIGDVPGGGTNGGADLAPRSGRAPR